MTFSLSEWLVGFWTDCLLTEWLPVWLNGLIIDWIIGSRSDCIWLNDCLTDYMTSPTEWLVYRRFVDWMTAWMFGLHTVYWLNDCLSDRFTGGLSTEWLPEWLVYRRFVDWMTAWMIEWPYHRLNYWFTLWLHLTEWLPDWLHDLTHWMIGLQTICWLNDCLTDWMNLSETELLVHGLTICWLNDRMTDLMTSPTECLSHWSNVCWLNDYLVQWITDSLNLNDWFMGQLLVELMTAKQTDWTTGKLNGRVTEWMTTNGC
jgi:hypothetical protein